MARYRVLERCYVGNQILEAGTEIGDGTPIAFFGEPGPHMGLIEPPPEPEPEIAVPMKKGRPSKKAAT